MGDTNIAEEWRGAVKLVGGRYTALEQRGQANLVGDFYVTEERQRSSTLVGDCNITAEQRGATTSGSTLVGGGYTAAEQQHRRLRRRARSGKDLLHLQPWPAKENIGECTNRRQCRHWETATVLT